MIVRSLSEIHAEVDTFKREARKWYEHRGQREQALMYFRGVPDVVAHKLVPSVGRNCSEQTALERERRLIQRLLSELRVLYQRRDVLRVQRELAARLAELFSDLNFNNDEATIPVKWQLPLIAFAQHYRIETRLLDWSECPRVAAFFAVQNGKDTEGKDGGLYVFHDRTALSVGGGARLFPKPSIEYVRPFRIWRDSGKYYEQWRNMIGLDEAWRFEHQKAVLTFQPKITQRLDEQLVEESKSEENKWRYQKLWCLKIPAGDKKHIQDELAKDDITYDALFRGPLENLCRRVGRSCSVSTSRLSLNE